MLGLGQWVEQQCQDASSSVCQGQDNGQSSNARMLVAVFARARTMGRAAMLGCQLQCMLGLGQWVEQQCQDASNSVCQDQDNEQSSNARMLVTVYARARTMGRAAMLGCQQQCKLGLGQWVEQQCQDASNSVCQSQDNGQSSNARMLVTVYARAKTMSRAQCQDASNSVSQDQDNGQSSNARMLVTVFARARTMGRAAMLGCQQQCLLGLGQWVEQQCQDASNSVCQG